MPQRLATASNWADYLKKHNKDAEGVSDWEKYFLNPAKQYYESQAQTISAQTEYDISGAYQNYLRTQRNLLQNQQLASGFKEQVSQEAKSAYESAYAQARTQEAVSLHDVSKAYAETLAKEDERLKGLGEQLASFEEKLYEYAGVDSSYATEIYGKELKDEEGNILGTGLGHYELNTETGEYELTDRGKAFIQDLLYGETRVGPNSFESYLTDQEDTKLLNFYSENQDLINEVFGLTAGQRAPDEKLTKSVADKNYEDKLLTRRDELNIGDNLTQTYSNLKKTTNNVFRQAEYAFSYTDQYGAEKTITTTTEYSENRNLRGYLNILKNSGIGTNKNDIAKLKNGDVVKAKIDGVENQYLYYNNVFYKIVEKK